MADFFSPDNIGRILGGADAARAARPRSRLPEEGPGNRDAPSGVLER